METKVTKADKVQKVFPVHQDAMVKQVWPEEMEKTDHLAWLVPPVIVVDQD